MTPLDILLVLFGVFLGMAIEHHLFCPTKRSLPQIEDHDRGAELIERGNQKE